MGGIDSCNYSVAVGSIHFVVGTKRGIICDVAKNGHLSVMADDGSLMMFMINSLLHGIV